MSFEKEPAFANPLLISQIVRLFATPVVRLRVQRSVHETILRDSDIVQSLRVRTLFRLDWDELSLSRPDMMPHPSIPARYRLPIVKHCILRLFLTAFSPPDCFRNFSFRNLLRAFRENQRRPNGRNSFGQDCPHVFTIVRDRLLRFAHITGLVVSITTVITGRTTSRCSRDCSDSRSLCLQVTQELIWELVIHHFSILSTGHCFCTFLPTGREQRRNGGHGWFQHWMLGTTCTSCICYFQISWLLIAGNGMPIALVHSHSRSVILDIPT